MSEPRSEPKGPGPSKDRSGSSLSRAISDVAEDLLPGASLEPTDDAPTIITKNAGRPIHSEDLFAGTTLRGRKLGHFELLEPIGVGGMAAVLRARDTQLDRTVALKILPPEMATDPENIRRFHQEARAAAKLDHENIARVFFCGEDQGLHFISFEFVEGENLRTILERRGRLPVSEAISYMLQIATGLDHASHRGVVHRDIKPSNIIISPNGRAKLVDMGLARSQDPHADAGLTQSGVTLGTFDYISPEQALEPREADVRSDIYSLGCTFYHLLTGHAPVPEGTAAKKLHHHQHVAPIDPRQLNPNIPDEVAAILARMMAKDPKDRYQRSEHLVQHLILVAQKLGVAADVPDGVLFVDAPLPSPPGLRPVLMAAVAGAALVALILLLGQTPWGTSTPKDPSFSVKPPLAEPKDKELTAAGGAAEVTRPLNPLPTPVIEAPPVARYDAAKPMASDLETFLRGKDKVAEVYLAGDLSLREDDGTTPTLIFDGKSLRIEPKDPGSWPTISFAYGARWRPSSSSTRPALTIQHGDVRIRHIRFVIDPTGSQDVFMAALQWQGGHVQFEDCQFIQVQPPTTGPGRVAAVELTGPHGAAAAPDVTFSSCYFVGVQNSGGWTGVAQGGQNALVWTNSAWVKMDNCAFGPHADLFSFQKTMRAEDGARLDLQQCSALLGGESTVFRLDKQASCYLDVARSVFSQPESGGDMGMDSSRATLIRQAAETPGTVQYRGSDNRYHNLSAFWRKGQTEIARDWTEFRREIERAGGEVDERVQVVDRSPWQQAKPLEKLEGLEKDRLREAFQVKCDTDELRQGNSLSRPPVGVLACTWEQTYDLEKLPGLSKKVEPVARKDKVVDPTALLDTPGVYQNLTQALAYAQPGDTILLKYTGIQPVDPVRLEKPDIDVTIKAHPGYRPVLTIGKTTEPDAFLFRIYDGKLALEGLEFLVQPASARFRTQTVVAMAGDGHCGFKDCTATLEDPSVDEPRTLRLALVTLSDPSTAMKMGVPAPAPVPAGRSQVRLENCFVRGDGSLMLVRPSRPFDLDVDNALVALTGSFLDVEGADTVPAVADMVRSNIRLDSITTFLTDHLVRVRAGKDIKGIVPIQFAPVKCLFVPAGNSALIHFDGLEAGDQQLRHLLDWKAGGNRYGNYMKMLDQQKDDAMPPPYFKEEWKKFTGDTSDRQFTRPKFSDPPAELSFARTKPAQFKNDQEVGADVDRLPIPTVPGMK